MKILKINSENLKIVIDSIKKSGVIIYPTDTVYGLIADATNKNAVKKVFKIKKRNIKKPLPVFVKDIKAAKKLANIGKDQEEFLKKFWPGKLTAVLKIKSLKLPKGIISEESKIGLRIPDYEFLNLLLNKLDCPLIATSANIAGKKASRKIRRVLKQFETAKNQPDLVLDAGNLKQALPSTVVDLEDFKILRKGPISQKQISGFLEKKISVLS